MIHVLIERQIAETLESHYEQYAKEILQKAVKVAGFISGESLKNAKNQNHRLIWSTWRSVQDWDAWYTSIERREMISVLRPMLADDEKITLLENA